MARALTGLTLRGVLCALLASATLTLRAEAEQEPQASAGARELPQVAKECGEASAQEAPLPRSATALQTTNKLKILAIGSTDAAVLGTSHDGHPPLLEQILERVIKGLDVEIINRGVSGELAESAATRLKIEVALTEPDLVLWQVGTNDAFAQVPVEEFQETVGGMVKWLKEHNVDVILVGLHYMKQLATDPHYQALRASLQRIAAAENVLRITRSEAKSVLSRAQGEGGLPDPGDFARTEAGYNCMAQYVARAITVGLFAKPPKPGAPALR
jgi:lysophospholipase L1-like esterase